MSPSQHVSDKAVRLYESGAVQVIGPGRATVRGDSGTVYKVTAFEDGIFCSCPSRLALCAHSCAAALAWADEAAGEWEPPGMAATSSAAGLGGGDVPTTSPRHRSGIPTTGGTP